MRKIPILILTLVSCAFVGLVSCTPNENGAQKPKSSSKKDKGPPSVSYSVVEYAPLSLSTEIAGRISAFRVAEIRPQVTGIIKARLFREGSRVNAGQPLYQIDASSYRTTYESSLASLSLGRANLAAAQSKFARYADLVKIHAVSEQEFEDARTALRVATANVEVAQAQVKATSINLRYANLSAPISGRISKSNVTEGALVTLNQPQALTSIVDISSVYVDFTQSYDQILKLRRDLQLGALSAPATAQVDLIMPDKSIYERSGQLLFTDLTVDPSTGSVGMRARFANPNGILLPGMYVHARLSRGTIANTITVPQKAVSIDQNGTAHVFLLSPDNKAQSQEITLGEMSGENWQILAGLKPGDKVIVDGLVRVRAGAQVKAKEFIKPKVGGL